MSVVFLGTSDFAASVLERLASSEHTPALVVTRPDRPRGRGRRLASPPVAVRARELGIPVEQPASVNEPGVRDAIARAGDGAGRVAGKVRTTVKTSVAKPADRECNGLDSQDGARVGRESRGLTERSGDDRDRGSRQTVVVCAFGALVKEPLLSEHDMLNVHPSLLPRWRGAAPIERAIMAGDDQTGVSIMRLTAGLDSGPVCMMEAEPILPEDTYGSLAARLAALGGELIVRVLDLSAGGRRPAFEEQDEPGATYAEKIGPEDRLLRPSASAVELERTVRALQPHVGARLALADGEFLGVHASVALAQGGAPAVAANDRRIPGPDEPVANEGQSSAPGESVACGGGSASGEPVASRGGSASGELMADRGWLPGPGEFVASDGRLLYGTADGVLELLTVQPPGGRAMDAAAFLRGHGLPGGR